MDRLRTPLRAIDIVIPAYNEEGGIAQVIETLLARLAVLPYRFEIIIVDDGSSDRTAEIASVYAERHPVRVIRLTRNFGKETALLAGLDHARGAATILMDADMQHPIDLIPEFLARWEEGYECVYGVKGHRRGETLFKRLATKAFYAGINRGAEVRIPADAQDFRLLDSAAVRALCSIRERVRFTKGLYAWLGFRSIGVPYSPPERAAGASRFDTARLLRLGWDGVTSFSDLPLRVSGVVGAAVAAAAVVYGLYIVAHTIAFGIDIPGWATLTIAVMFLGGLQILLLGVLGQYVRNVFLETKQRPNYLIREVVDSVASPRERVAAMRDVQLASSAEPRPVGVARSGRTAAA
jgi:glycosyltransferase involved in cell wall biosynthesis